MNSLSQRIAVIGAGISGLACARELTDHGLQVTVFEKARGVGGRMATRRTESGLRFDHGAQYFTVRDARFERYVQSWLQCGVVAQWKGRIAKLTGGEIEWPAETTPRFVGVPGMNAICRHLAAGLDIRFRAHVQPPQRHGDVWNVVDEQSNRLGEFEYVIVSPPAPQTAQLLVHSPALQQQVNSIAMDGCWAAMVTFDRPLELPFDGAFVHESSLSWVARNDSKPARPNQQECWVLHASAEWAAETLEGLPDEVLPQMLEAFWQANGISPRTPAHLAGHRWRYAIPVEPLDERCLFDAQRKIGTCGDWCGGPRVEGAFLSGMALADRILTATSAP